MVPARVPPYGHAVHAPAAWSRYESAPQAQPQSVTAQLLPAAATPDTGQAAHVAPSPYWFAGHTVEHCSTMKLKPAVLVPPPGQAAHDPAPYCVFEHAAQPPS